ncbi:uncharacterized protein LOC116768062 [Danaus plexippus]|nr:uncharacterized protein LOC116768062 [Danaus plexippus]
MNSKILTKLCLHSLSVLMLLQYSLCLNIESRENNTILSRRKRFLIFPEGSSLQLVFCVTYPVLTSIGDIFLWGNTAALAYELPQDPYSPFNHKADPLHRRMDTNTIYFTDYDGKIIYKKPYVKKFIVNPAFAKRSVDEYEKVSFEYKIGKKQMHASKHTRTFLKEHLGNIDFHRISRASLYQRIETLLQGLGSDGRNCVLKALCVIGQSQEDSQGAFLHEIMRAVFTIPKGTTSGDIDEEYDIAHTATEPCHELYPNC